MILDPYLRVFTWIAIAINLSAGAMGYISLRKFRRLNRQLDERLAEAKRLIEQARGFIK